MTCNLEYGTPTSSIYPNCYTVDLLGHRAKIIRYQILDSSKSDFSGRKGRFPEYFARHYRVQMWDSNIKDKEAAMKNRTLEIQYMSLLMHAWSKMQHELIYEPHLGVSVVDEDERLVDVSSGIIIAGGHLLTQIQINLDKKKEQRRLLFKN